MQALAGHRFLILLQMTGLTTNHLCVVQRVLPRTAGPYCCSNRLQRPVSRTTTADRCFEITLGRPAALSIHHQDHDRRSAPTILVVTYLAVLGLTVAEPGPVWIRAKQSF
ncbi:MAG: hypothetical protein D8M59_02635 [Planctomycetes bacterium]|nr:hypothetical protein [Planctomycetota bacterium]